MHTYMHTYIYTYIHIYIHILLLACVHWPPLSEDPAGCRLEQRGLGRGPEGQGLKVVRECVSGYHSSR